MPWKSPQHVLQSGFPNRDLLPRHGFFLTIRAEVAVIRLSDVVSILKHGLNQSRSASRLRRVGLGKTLHVERFLRRVVGRTRRFGPARCELCDWLRSGSSSNRRFNEQVSRFWH